MQSYFYDSTFEGLLTCIFDIYKRKEHPENISKINKQKLLFNDGLVIDTDSEKADRVWRGIQQRMSRKNKQLLYYAFLSEEQEVEMSIYRFLTRLFAGYPSLETDYGDSDVLLLSQLSESVAKEATRVLQFVRFQHTKDDIYFCGIDPKYDVIPLVTNHYKNRFSDQMWLIYDLKRNYGIFYNKEKVEEVVISKKEFDAFNGQVKQALLDNEEDSFQELWRHYFTHTNIKERKNLKLQRQFMPRRFWKYLPEKQ